MVFKDELDAPAIANALAQFLQIDADTVQVSGLEQDSAICTVTCRNPADEISPEYSSAVQDLKTLVAQIHVMSKKLGMLEKNALEEKDRRAAFRGLRKNPDEWISGKQYLERMWKGSPSTTFALTFSNTANRHIVQEQEREWLGDLGDSFSGNVNRSKIRARKNHSFTRQESKNADRPPLDIVSIARTRKARKEAKALSKLQAKRRKGWKGTPSTYKELSFSSTANRHIVNDQSYFVELPKIERASQDEAQKRPSRRVKAIQRRENAWKGSPHSLEWNSKPSEMERMPPTRTFNESIQAFEAPHNYERYKIANGTMKLNHTFGPQKRSFMDTTTSTKPRIKVETKQKGEGDSSETTPADPVAEGDTPGVDGSAGDGGDATTEVSAGTDEPETKVEPKPDTEGEAEASKPIKSKRKRKLSKKARQAAKASAKQRKKLAAAQQKQEMILAKFSALLDALGAATGEGDTAKAAPNDAGKDKAGAVDVRESADKLHAFLQAHRRVNLTKIDAAVFEKFIGVVASALVRDPMWPSVLGLWELALNADRSATLNQTDEVISKASVDRVAVSPKTMTALPLKSLLKDTDSAQILWKLIRVDGQRRCIGTYKVTRTDVLCDQKNNLMCCCGEPSRACTNLIHKIYFAFVVCIHFLTDLTRRRPARDHPLFHSHYT